MREQPGVGAGQPRKFTGKERDQETALDYFGARYHGSGIARFTTIDPVMNIQASLGDPQRWNRYSYARNNPVRYIDPDGRDVRVACSGTSCTASVRAQIVADPNDPAQVAAANGFKAGAEGYWNSTTVNAPSGETISFDVQFTVVSPSQQSTGMDTLTVVNGTGTANVRMHLNTTQPPGSPDTGTIYTQDNTGNPSGMAGIAPHEAGHLMGLRDLGVPGQPVPNSPGPKTDIMHTAQPGNSPASAHFVLSPANGNSVVTRKPTP